MSEQPNFDYYYGSDSEQFRYIKIPRLIIEDMVFYKLSDRAKILYGIMLDRMSLSRTNGWIDEMNRVYIRFSIKNIAVALNCSLPTACKAIAELDTDKGIGLIERIRHGQGQSDLIYVKNFASYLDGNPDVGKEIAWDSTYDETTDDNGQSDADDPIQEEVTDPEIQDSVGESQNSISLNSKILNSRILNSRNLNSKSFNPSIQESLIPELKEFDPNNTNINNTDLSNTEGNTDGLDRLDGYARVVAQIQQNIDYESLSNYPDEEKRATYEEIYQLICDVVLVPEENIKINGKNYPYEMVRSRFMSLRFEHVIYVTGCMAENFGKVSNIRNYLITALYNAPLTIQNHADQDYRESTHTKVVTPYELECEERLEELRAAGVVKKYF